MLLGRLARAPIQRNAALAALTSTRAISTRTQLIKQLRERTSAPMKKCVDALDKAGNDIEAAVDILRKSGVAAAAKKAGRGTTEGAAAVAHDGTTAAFARRAGAKAQRTAHTFCASVSR